MTENQEKQMMSMLTKCVNGIQRLEESYKKLEGDFTEMKGDVSELKSDVSELKGDVSELKSGQTRMEKDIKIINKSLSTLAENSLESRSRIEILEEKIELSN